MSRQAATVESHDSTAEVETREKVLALEAAHLEHAIGKLNEVNSGLARLRDAAMVTLGETTRNDHAEVGHRYGHYLEYVFEHMKRCSDEARRLEEQRQNIESELHAVRLARSLSCA